MGRLDFVTFDRLCKSCVSNSAHVSKDERFQRAYSILSIISSTEKYRAACLSSWSLQIVIGQPRLINAWENLVEDA